MLGAISLTPIFPNLVRIGNINPLVLLTIVGFVTAHLAGRQRTAGILLGVAIAIKLWPVALIVVVIRSRVWQELRWAFAVLLLQAGGILVWLGIDVVPHIASTTQAVLTSVIPSDVFF